MFYWLIVVCLILIIVIILISQSSRIQNTIIFPYSVQKKFDKKSLGYVKEHTTSDEVSTYINKRVIIHFHGNSETAEDAKLRLQTLIGYKYFIEYPGFSNIASESEINPDTFWSYIFDITKSIIDKHQDDDIILYGRSIGTGVVCRLIEENIKSTSVILETPFLSLNHIVSSKIGWLVTTFLSTQLVWQMDNSNIADYTKPVLIIAGRDDKLIPLSQAEDLSKLNQTTKLESVSYGHIIPARIVINIINSFYD